MHNGRARYVGDYGLTPEQFDAHPEIRFTEPHEETQVFGHCGIMTG